MHIKIFTAGGTIDKVYFDSKSEYEVGEPQIEQLLKLAGVNFTYDVEVLFKKDSVDITDEDRAMLAESVKREESKRVVITHGTDTILESAMRLRGIAGKTIVFTGSLTPARFRDSDALFNIGCAVTAVQILEPGVYVAINGQVYRPDEIRKKEDRSRFEVIDE